ncbi:hypothetical protein ACET3Z_021414 [Daucus carota]
MASKCFSRKWAAQQTAWTTANAGRRFWTCPDRCCNYFRWIDPPLCARAQAIIPEERDQGVLSLILLTMAESIQGNNSFDNSDLRGVLFKPGHYAPVTAEIDVAPHLSMIRGKETPHATQKRSDARQRRPKESHQQRANYLGNGSSAHPLAANLLTRRDITATVTAPSVEARGTVVPVVLEPGNAVAEQDALMAAPKGKNMQTVTPPTTYKLKLPAPNEKQKYCWHCGFVGFCILL